MPWLEATPMEQRERFIRDQQNGLYTMTELCDRHNISRKTGYKWLDRFDAGGRAALGDRSRAPHRCPHRIPSAVAELICTARRQHPRVPPQHAGTRPEGDHAFHGVNAVRPGRGSGQ